LKLVKNSNSNQRNSKSEPPQTEVRPEFSNTASWQKGINSTLKQGLAYTAVLWCVFAAVSVVADSNEKLLGDRSSGTRSESVHLIELLDEQGQKISPEDELLMPFSTRQTCGQCHDYNAVAVGWHFNATDANVAAGRVGQPWIFVDARTATQIPLSYRRWPGTFRPEQIGLSEWDFTKTFARQMPGGGPGELERLDDPDLIMRKFVSGRLEINCLTCHSAEAGHDQAEYGLQAARENFRWAAAATSGFTEVTGSAADMPDTYDPLMPGMLTDPELRPPAVTYRKNAFDHKNRVLFDIPKKISKERCYFCHSNFDLHDNQPESWKTDEDVHLAAGLTCVDCHRNGLDHRIVRGYETEEEVSPNPLSGQLTCEGCHTSGRLGAPEMTHAGIPPSHFDRLSCTACHSGLWPGRETSRTKTARAHALGMHNVDAAADVLPHIFTPVFAEQANGKIGPHKLIWPAFWATLEDQAVKPLNLETVRAITSKIIRSEKPLHPGNWRSLSDDQITQILKLLQREITDGGECVYICGGRMYRLDEDEQLLASRHRAAQPYLWPIAHNVRPARQALGANQCEDCHAANAAFFFGDVTVEGPFDASTRAARKMIEFQDVDAGFARVFALSFVFRPLLKIVALFSSALLAGVLVLYGLKALWCVAKVLGTKQ